jgi:hypothetical protein
LAIMEGMFFVFRISIVLHRFTHWLWNIYWSFFVLNCMCTIGPKKNMFYNLYLLTSDRPYFSPLSEIVLLENLWILCKFCLVPELNLQLFYFKIDISKYKLF